MPDCLAYTWKIWQGAVDIAPETHYLSSKSLKVEEKPPELRVSPES